MTWGLRDVRVCYGERVALEGVSLVAQPGSVTAVVGGDGSGKTTLLRALVGVLRPESGTVSRPPRERIGYFSASSGVYPDLTVVENLSFVASAYRTHDAARQARLLEAAGLDSAATRLAGTLSGGMRQKLGVVMAMLHRPDLLVLDEPSTGIDPVSRAELGRLIAGAAAAGAAVVLSSAYLDEAERAGFVLVLEDGHELRSGAPDHIVATVPGAVVVAGTDRNRSRSWHRGADWVEWMPPGVALPAAARSIPLVLEDAVIVASLEQEASMRREAG